MRDGERVHLGISTGGHYLSEDRGETFRASNKGVGAGFAPDPYPEFGQCVHKIVGHDAAPGRLYMQNHGGWADWTGPGGPRPNIGVLRSDDHGRSWRSIAAGLPSDFGFPIVVHPRNADTVYVMPLEPATRTCPGGAPAVWRSENGGESWSRLARGLPKKETYFTVQRDAMTIDRLSTPALYFGTTTGQLWIGREGGSAVRLPVRLAAPDPQRQGRDRLSGDQARAVSAGSATTCRWTTSSRSGSGTRAMRRGGRAPEEQGREVASGRSALFTDENVDGAPKAAGAADGKAAVMTGALLPESVPATTDRFAR